MTSPTHSRIYWEETCSPPAFPELSGDFDVDVAIIGGGMVGISTARMLKDQGMTVAVVEARRVGQGVTGKATAKVTSQHGITYQTIEQKFGEDRTRLYADAQETGLRRILELSRTHGVDADIEPMPAFVYTREVRHVSDIEEEVEVARKLGLPATLTRDTGLPFDVVAAMRWDNQAQFHPLKFVSGLAATIPGDGCHIFENSRVTDWDPNRIATDRGTVRARHVAMASQPTAWPGRSLLCDQFSYGGAGDRGTDQPRPAGLLQECRAAGAFDPDTSAQRPHLCGLRRIPLQTRARQRRAEAFRRHRAVAPRQFRG